MADALTYTDRTTSPDGRPVTVEERSTDVLRRHGPDSPTARVPAIRAPAIRSAVRRYSNGCTLPHPQRGPVR